MDVYVLKNLIGPEIYGVYKDEAAAEKAQSKLEMGDFNNEHIVLEVTEPFQIKGNNEEVYVSRDIKFHLIYDAFSDRAEAIRIKKLLGGQLIDKLEVVGPFKIKENI